MGRADTDPHAESIKVPMDSGVMTMHLDRQLIDENQRLRASMKSLRDIHQQRMAELLGEVNKREILSDASNHGKQLSSVEGALTDISRMLIEAQEQERDRIARELHDDINQRLVLLTIGIEQARHDLISASPAKVDHRLHELNEEVRGIAADIHNIAHDLHSSILEYLGFVPAVRKLAQEMGRRHGIQIEIKHEGLPSALPANISLCLFRVIQEALHNAARHSGTKRVEVRVEKTVNQIHLTLRDSGKGFDVAAIAGRQGLGLASMRERIRLVNGKITILSERAVGTCIQAWVPFQSGVVPRPPKR
jgi:signal transduction histidine kinase